MRPVPGADNRRRQPQTTGDPARYPAPSPNARRGSGEFLHGRSERLPDGLPGLADSDRGLLVLPKECDVDGRPAAVTLRTHSTRVSPSGTSHRAVATLDTRDVAKMLLAAAGRGMRKAGCVPAAAPRLSSPFPGRLPVRSRTGGDKHVQIRHVQICSVTIEVRGGEPTLAGRFVMVSGLPRLEALFDGMTGEAPSAAAWRGKGRLGPERAVVRADCGGAGAVFFQRPGEGMQRAASPGPERAFANGVDAGTRRAVCTPVAPANAGTRPTDRPGRRRLPPPDEAAAARMPMSHHRPGLPLHHSSISPRPRSVVPAPGCRTSTDCVPGLGGEEPTLSPCAT